MGVLGARETRGARKEGGRETPARKPLFSQSRLLIMHAKITQLWMTSCQISLAAMRLFKSYFAYCFSLVFLKQEIWSEGTIKKSINAVVCWRKKVATMRGLLDEIQLFLVVTPYWRAPKRAKQLSMATIPLCFEFFRCRVDVLQS